MPAKPRIPERGRKPPLFPHAQSPKPAHERVPALPRFAALSAPCYVCLRLALCRASSPAMKARIKGRKDLKALRAALMQAVDDMERFGIEAVQGCNLYFTPLDEDGEMMQLRKNGRRFEEWTITRGYDCAADEYET